MRRADIEVPNLPVDVDSWGRSACYPRGSFYPLSDGPPTRYHRITKSYFRTCSTCWCRSQPSFCLCTLRTISNRSEENFERLRYFLGGDRPSQTARLTLSRTQFHGYRLESQYCQGGIPTVAPRILTNSLPCLPPILYRQYRNSVLNYSKALRGLSVQPQVASIFTCTTISPDSLSRQCPSHYAIRAGRNLPDKEFRYLRTVIVTAAVYWGLSSHLRLR